MREGGDPGFLRVQRRECRIFTAKLAKDAKRLR
jgi:hypothetical protein